MIITDSYSGLGALSRLRQNKMGLSIMLILFALFTARPMEGAQNQKWGKLDLTHASMSWDVRKTGEMIVAENRMTRHSFTVFQDTREEKDVDGEIRSSEMSYDIVSLVGPVLTVFEHRYLDTGVHPSYGGFFKVINLDKGHQMLSITDLFDEAVVLNALLNDRVVRKAIGNNLPKSLEELAQMADGGCEISFHELARSFAFHHIKGDAVAIRFGLPHGCEAMRGRFTQIGIYLPIPDSVTDYFKVGEKERTLMRYLWRFR